MGLGDIVIVQQLFLIIVGMFLFSLLLNKIFGIKKKDIKEMRMKTLNLRERMKNAQILGDPVLMQQLQVESIQLMKQMLKKQIVPMCFRCIIFIGIFVMLSFIYADYGPASGFFFGLGWFWLYFFMSLGFSLTIMIIKIIFKKLSGKPSLKEKLMTEISSQKPEEEGTEVQDSWKERLERED